jgi:hypothetical protein
MDDDGKELRADVVMLLDLLDGIDLEEPKWSYLLAIGFATAQIRERLGATDRLPPGRLHTNDEQVEDLAFERFKIIETIRGER